MNETAPSGDDTLRPHSEGPVDLSAEHREGPFSPHGPPQGEFRLWCVEVGVMAPTETPVAWTYLHETSQTNAELAAYHQLCLAGFRFTCASYVKASLLPAQKKRQGQESCQNQGHPQTI